MRLTATSTRKARRRWTSQRAIEALEDLVSRRLLVNFMARRYDRCKMVVDNSLQIGEWQKQPRTAGADPAGLIRESQRILAQAI